MPGGPNLVVIMADDLGFGDLGVYNFGATTTPAIDSLARDGLAMSQHYSASPICAPSRAGFLTGRYPQRSGVIDTFPHLRLDELAARERTIGDLLQAAGYVTGMVGKWHNGALGPDTHPTRRGFDEFAGFRGGGQDYWDWRLDINGHVVWSDGRYLTDVFTEEALGFLDRHAGERFALFVNYTAPHGPFQAPAPDVAAASADGVPDTVAIIRAMVSVMDRGIARILDRIESDGVASDTVVMFTSDNGPWMRPGDFVDTTTRYNLGLARGKEYVHEGGIRVPMFVRWPGVVEAGTTTNHIAHFTDWVSTLMSIVGGPHAEGPPSDGVDLSGLLRDGVAPEARTRFWQWSRYQPIWNVNAAVRSDRWKLLYPAIDRVLEIRPQDPQQERIMRADPDTYATPPWMTIPSYPDDLESCDPQLFDVASDPGETVDLADRQPEILRRLRAELEVWFDDVEGERHRLGQLER
jgi:arylsulfatase A